MPLEFQPILSILEPSQRRLWDEFDSIPRAFVLCGGTAVALQLGHRSSVDFDSSPRLNSIRMNCRRRFRS
jgi:hypothetical protein